MNNEFYCPSCKKKLICNSAFKIGEEDCQFKCNDCKLSIRTSIDLIEIYSDEYGIRKSRNKNKSIISFFININENGKIYLNKVNCSEFDRDFNCIELYDYFNECIDNICFV